MGEEEGQGPEAREGRKERRKNRKRMRNQGGKRKCYAAFHPVRSGLG